VEQGIAIQRHELRNSIRVINELVDEMTKSASSEGTAEKAMVQSSDLWSLKYFGLLARSQVHRLYQDQVEDRALNISPTEIHSQIVVRVCQIVGKRSGREKMMAILPNKMTGCPLSHRIHVDPRYVEQAFLNLIINAVKYGGRGTDIKMLSWETDEGTSISVMNCGPGIEEAEREKVFESGYRSRKAIALATGSGLGLSITRVIMEKHHGKVTLDQLADPTTFTLFFQPPSGMHHPEPTHSVMSKILFIDDEPDENIRAKRALERLNFEVKMASRMTWMPWAFLRSSWIRWKRIFCRRTNLPSGFGIWRVEPRTSWSGARSLNPVICLISAFGKAETSGFRRSTRLMLDDAAEWTGHCRRSWGGA
jgi:hypothetical protein